MATDIEFYGEDVKNAQAKKKLKPAADGLLSTTDYLRDKAFITNPKGSWSNQKEMMGKLEVTEAQYKLVATR